ncbi:MAG: hypothetical protein GY870_16290, partial [archaeon]|nr:hypothetical protein [archaeon]
MESETKKEKNTIKTMIVCPVCQVSGYIYLPKENFNKSKKGVSSILLSNTGICPHSYQIFVDKNGAVRGYETPDFELKFVATEKKPEEEEKLGTIGSLQIIRALLGEELLFKCIRTALIGDQIYCLTDNNYLVKFFKQFFE